MFPVCLSINPSVCQDYFSQEHWRLANSSIKQLLLILAINSQQSFKKNMPCIKAIYGRIFCAHIAFMQYIFIYYTYYIYKTLIEILPLYTYICFIHILIQKKYILFMTSLYCRISECDIKN